MWVIPKRKPKYPLSLEREYARILARYCDENMKGIRMYAEEIKTLLEAYRVRIDAFGVNSHIEVLIDRLKNAMKSPEQMRSSVEKMFDRVNAFNLQDFDAVIKSVLGAPLRDLPFDKIHQDDLESNLEQLKEMWVEQNLELIKSIDEETLAKIKRQLQAGIIGNVAGARKTSEIIAEIEKIAKAEHNRAVLIGSDQVGKLNSRLAQYRQQNAGLTHYVWQTAGDQRVRPRHQQFSGRTFSWERGSDEGHPGEPVRCRCVAIPVIDLDRVVTEPREGSYKDITHRLSGASEETYNMLTSQQKKDIKLLTSLQRKIEENASPAEQAETLKKALNFAKDNLGANVIDTNNMLVTGTTIQKVFSELEKRKKLTGIFFNEIVIADYLDALTFAETNYIAKRLVLNGHLMNSPVMLSKLIEIYKRDNIIPKKVKNALKFMVNHEWGHLAADHAAKKLENAIYEIVQKYKGGLLTFNSRYDIYELVADTIGASFAPEIDCQYAIEVLKCLRDKEEVVIL